MRRISNFTPVVPNYVLLLLAGIVWMFVGIMLLVLASSWLSTISHFRVSLFTGIGVVSALIAHHFGFLKIVDKNLNRILLSKDKKCLFAFIPWQSYLIIIVMITIGAVLRHSAIPKSYLAIIYIGIGLALILSSVRYIRVFITEIGR